MIYVPVFGCVFVDNFKLITKTILKLNLSIWDRPCDEIYLSKSVKNLYYRYINILFFVEVKKLLQDAKFELKKSQRKDYYKILGVSKDASTEDIKKAYRKRALVHHPGNYIFFALLFQLYYLHQTLMTYSERFFWFLLRPKLLVLFEPSATQSQYFNCKF